jgi:hypothetical protein
MKSKYLLKLDSGEICHLISEKTRAGQIVTGFIEQQDGSKARHTGRIVQVLSTMPLSKRESFAELRQELDLNDLMVARLLRVDPVAIERWTTGRTLIPSSCHELIRVAGWLHQAHPEVWLEWRQRLTSDGDDE